MHADRRAASIMTNIQEGHACLYSTALTMLEGYSYVIKPHFHNQDLVPKPIAVNLKSGKEFMINMPQLAKAKLVQQSAQLKQSTEQTKCPSSLSKKTNSTQQIQVVAT